jgi:hypothetical protein
MFWIRTQVFENLSRTLFAPSVQMQGTLKKVMQIND